MSNNSAAVVTRDVLLALSFLARLSARPDLPIATRLAVGFGRELLDDFHVDATCFVREAEPFDLQQTADRALVWLGHDVRRRGRLAWRSQEAAELLDAALAGHARR